MLRRLVAGGTALAVLLLLLAPPVPRVALASARTCTGWTSEYVPPTTIRVYRTVGPARGSVQVVPFRRYVDTVLAAEFGASAPVEALRAGAIIVKQYGWYFARVWRGGSTAHGGCYDVTDNGVDQVYWPERIHPGDRQLQAVQDTWTISLRKYGRFIPTGYDRGASTGSCGSNADGWHLYQASAYRCALEGMLYPEILRTYYGPGFGLIQPGINDVNGQGTGSIGIAVPGTPGAGGGDSPASGPGSPGAVASASPAPTSAMPSPSATPEASPTASPLPAASTTPFPVPATGGFYDTIPADGPQQTGQPAALPAGTSPDPVTTLGWAFSDVDHDGRADVLRLERMGSAGYRIQVSRSLGGGRFGPATTWWSDVGGGLHIASDASVQLLAGDFTGDGIGDAALLVGSRGTPPMAAAGDGTPGTPAVVPPARLYLLRSDGTGFAAPQTWWSGQLDVARAQAFAADVTGDGRADLVVATDLYPSDLAAPADPAAPTPTSSPDGSATTSSGPTAGPGGTELPVGIRFLVARSGPGGGLGPLTTWYDMTDTVAAQARIVVEDVNADGYADVVVLRPSGSAGSQLVGLLSNGARFSRVTLWSSTSFSTAASKMAAADVNGDGLGDVVVLYDAGSAGTRLYRFISTGTAFVAGAPTLDPALDWGTVQPF